MDKQDLIVSYSRLRDILTAHHEAALHLITYKTLQERAKQLGMVHRREIVSENDLELQMLYDYAIHTAKPGKSRAIDRYARIALSSCGPDEACVLEALVHATFSIWQVARLHDVAGVVLRDRVRGGEIWLLDVSMAATATRGMTFAGRVCQPGEFAMNTGVIVPMSADAADTFASGMLSVLGVSPGNSVLDALGNDLRFATELYRFAIVTGLMDDVLFVEPEHADLLSSLGHEVTSRIINAVP